MKKTFLLGHFFFLGVAILSYQVTGIAGKHKVLEHLLEFTGIPHFDGVSIIIFYF